MKNSSDFIAVKVHQQRRNGCENMSNHSSYHTKFSQFIVHGWFSSFSFEQTNIKICFSFQWIENEKIRFESDFCGVFIYAIVMKWDFHCCPSPHCCCVGWFFKKSFVFLAALKVGGGGSERRKKLTTKHYYVSIFHSKAEWNVVCNANMICISQHCFMRWSFHGIFTMF